MQDQVLLQEAVSSHHVDCVLEHCSKQLCSYPSSDRLQPYCEAHTLTLLACDVISEMLLPRNITGTTTNHVNGHAQFIVVSVVANGVYPHGARQ